MSQLFDYFDLVYLINLASRRDRRREMIAEFKRVGIEPESPQLVWFNAVRPDDAGPFPTLGAHGCFLSHLRVLEDAAAKGSRRILIMEDDLDFLPDFANRIPSLLEALRANDWSVVYGTYLLEGPQPSAPGPFVELDPEVRLINSQFLGFQGEAIRECAEYLEAMLRRPLGHPDGGPMHVDGAYSWYRRVHPHRRTVIASPQLGFERPSRTDVHQLQWYDSWPLVRNLAALARRLLRRLRSPT